MVRYQLNRTGGKRRQRFRQIPSFLDTQASNVLVNAVIVQVKTAQIPMSGNATYRELARHAESPSHAR
jgi:hypothetical protein